MSDLIASRISRALAKSGISKVAAAKQLGVSRSSIQSWTSGRYVPSPEHLVKIAELTGEDLDWLAGVEGPHESPLGLTATIKAILDYVERHDPPPPELIDRLAAIVTDGAVQRVAQQIVESKGDTMAHMAYGIGLALTLESNFEMGKSADD